jgi:hypothetical protein
LNFRGETVSQVGILASMRWQNRREPARFLVFELVAVVLHFAAWSRYLSIAQPASGATAERSNGNLGDTGSCST